MEAVQGVAWRSPSEEQRLSGAGLRQRLGKGANPVAPHPPRRLPLHAPSEAVTVRQRAARRAVQGAFDAAAAAAWVRRVAAPWRDGAHTHGGPSPVEYAFVGSGRRLQMVDLTHVAVSLQTRTYERSGVVKNDDGTRSRGYKLATVRTWLDHAGLITQGGLGLIHVQAVP